MLGNKEVMAKNIKHYMELNKVNSTEMCQTLGFKQSTFSNWINAKIYPRIDKIEKMAIYFGISKAALVEENPLFHQENVTHSLVPYITNEDRYIIRAYHAAPEHIKEAVKKLLDISTESVKKEA